MNKIHFIDAHCGAGKTEEAILHMINGVGMGRRYILLQPKIELIEQTKARFDHHGYSGPLEIIHGENSSETVTKRIHAFLDRSDEAGVLISTHQGWEGIQRRKMGDIHLIVDECPTIYRVSKVDTQRLKDEILQHLKFEVEADGYSKVSVRSGSDHALAKIQRVALNDEALKPLAKTAKFLSLKTKTWVKTEFYESFVSGASKSLTFYHVTSPKMFSGFKSVTIMSANFTHTELYLLWKYWGIRFKQISGLTSKELYSTHPKSVGEKLDIYYLNDEWSKHLKGKHLKIYIQEYRRAITEIFGKEDYIHTVNKGDDEHMLQGVGSGRYVNPKAHGNNEYREYNNAAVFAHFNMSNDQVSFLINKFRISKKHVWDIRNIDIYYQFVCRTSLREVPSAGSDVANKKIIVMDKDMGMYLQTKFEGSRVHKFQSDLIASIDIPKRGRKSIGSKPATSAERMKKSRANRSLVDISRKLDILTGKYEVINEPVNDQNIPGFSDEMIFLRTDNKNSGRGGWSVSILGKENADTFISETINEFDELVQFLSEMSKRHIERKKDNVLFNVTTFSEQKGGVRKRTLAHVIYSNAILMDMDSENNHDPEEFAQFFSGIEMVIYSSFQSSLERRRWRVVINISRAVTEAEYNRIAKDLLDICESRGFDFDRKMRANDFMYLPCRGENEDSFFFKHYNDAGRKPLDVDGWFNSQDSQIFCKNNKSSANDNVIDMIFGNQITKS